VVESLSETAFVAFCLDSQALVLNQEISFGLQVQVLWEIDQDVHGRVHDHDQNLVSLQTLREVTFHNFQQELLV
jgi:hypothetical protein